MKWSISLIAFCAALATASPTPEKAIEDNQGATLARRQGFCPKNDDKCCCQCAAANDWPCLGCTKKASSSTKQRACTSSHSSFG